MSFYFVRFSKPGGLGFIPGNSKIKFRSDWIEVESLSWGMRGRSTGAATRSSPDPVVFTRPVDSLSPTFMKLSVIGQSIDQIVFEMAKDDNTLQLRVTLTDTEISGYHSLNNTGAPQAMEAVEITYVKIEFQNIAPPETDTTEPDKIGWDLHP
jgi:type VI protein secretion system component Hcp